MLIILRRLTDPLIVGTEVNHTVFVYMINVEEAEAAMDDLNGCVIQEHGCDGQPQQMTRVTVRLATWEDLRKGLDDNVQWFPHEESASLVN